jgi:hypothetical protein
LLSALKKKQRDRDAFSAYHDAVIEELGDTLWYFANAALRSGLTLSSIAHHAPATLSDWDYRGQSGPQTFADLQRPSPAFAGPVANDALERRLIALAGKVGHLLEDWSGGRIAGNRDLLAADLVEIFRALLPAADDAEVSLEAAARRNIVKTLERWPETLDWGPLFDADFALLPCPSVICTGAWRRFKRLVWVRGLRHQAIRPAGSRRHCDPQGVGRRFRRPRRARGARARASVEGRSD